jgi:hypothetical protein
MAACTRVIRGILRCHPINYCHLRRVPFANRPARTQLK